MKNTSVVALLVGLLFCAVVSPVPSSASSNSVQLSGSITDASGGTLEGVLVRVMSADRPDVEVASTLSKSDGTYTVSVTPGKYRVAFSLTAFATQESTVDLTAGAAVTLDIRLVLASLSTNVLVTSQATPIANEDSPVSTTIISQKEVEERQTGSLPDLLSFSPGVAFGRTGAYGGTTSLFLNGGNSNFTKVLIDGTPINPPGGAVDFSLLTTDNVGKVELVRGAESALYGSDAVSGVVQVFSQRGTTRTPAFSLFSEGGNFSSYRGGGQISGLVDKFDYSAAGSYLTTDGQGPNDEFVNRGVTANVGYSFSDTNVLRLTVHNNDSGAGIPGQTEYTPPSLHQRYDQELFSAGASWDFTTGEHWHNEIRGDEAYTRQHSFNPLQSFYIGGPDSYCPQDPANPNSVPTTEFCDYTYDSLVRYNTVSLNAQTSYQRQNYALTAGYFYQIENAGIEDIPEGHLRRNNQAGYLDLRYTPIARLFLNAGIRIEDNQDFGTRGVPRVGGTFILHYGKDWWGTTRYRAFYGQGIKEPRLDQTYGTDPCDPGNLSLKPEASKNWSTGIEQNFFKDRVKVSADYFYYRFYDIVSFAFCTTSEGCGFPPPTTCPYGYGSYFNTDLSYSRGTNIAGQANLLRWLFFQGSYTYDDTRIVKAPNAFDPTQVAGNRLARRPLNSGSIGFVATYRRFNASLNGYFSGVRTDSDFLGLGYTRNPGYARFDFAATYLVTHAFSVYFRATNLFDKSYQDALGYPALGRDARIGIRYQFAGRN